MAGTEIKYLRTGTDDFIEVREETMITVRDIMTKDLITVTPDMNISKAAKILLENRINGAPVVDDNGSLVGILCQSDLIAQQKKLPIPTLFTLLDGIIQLTSNKQIEKQIRKIAALTVSEAMTAKVVSVHPDTEIETVAALMVDSNFHTLPVVEETRLVGVIGKEDVLRTLLPPIEGN
jgi:CBS domain-containing protein